MNGIRKVLCLFLFVLAGTLSFGQSVPLGIFYQAVARDNFGKEIASRNIDVRFSIIKGNKLGTTVYQELHSPVTTSKFGVFTLIIGKGAPTDVGLYNALDQIDWSNSYHYLKIEVKFENDFVDMGTMQFLAVPYALYAQKSLEPGPQGLRGDPGPPGQQGVQGLKGEQGDPATDDQTLSFDGSNISISGGNTVNLSSLLYPHQLTILGDTLAIMGGNKVGLPNQIQDLQLDPNNKLKITKNTSATEIDFTKFLDDKQQLTFNSVDNTLVITGGNTVNLASLKNDADADPLNEIQSLTFTPADNKLYISGITTPVDLTALKNDADASPTNEIQTLTFDKNSGDLTISSKPAININYSIGFKAKKSTTQTGLTIGQTYPFVNGEAEFIEGIYNSVLCYDAGNGTFTVPSTGIYTFNIYYKADGSGSSRILTLLKNEVVLEIIGPDISADSQINKWVTYKLNQGDILRLTIFTGMSTFSGTGLFLGYKVN